jgi:hypothetical protein
MYLCIFYKPPECGNPRNITKNGLRYFGEDMRENNNSMSPCAGTVDRNSEFVAIDPNQI